MKPADPDIITAAEVGTMLGMREHGIYEAAANGEIPHRRLGRRVLFSRRQIIAWIHGEAPPPRPLPGGDPDEPPPPFVVP